MIWRLGLSCLILVIGIYLYLSPPKIQVDLNHSKTHQKLDALLSKWSDDLHLVKPELYLRLNPTNEGYYSTNLITLLVSINSYENSGDPFLEVALAHEFGHHVVLIKQMDDNPSLLEQEKRADLIALKLIGPEKMLKAFSQEANRGKSEDHPSFPERLELIKNYKE